METFEPTPRECGAEDSKSPAPASVDDRTKLAEGAPGAASDLLGPPEANRHRLQNERSAITHHFAFGGHEGYLTVGFYPNGQPGEIFIRMAKAGSTIAGLMECFGTVVSVNLQHGVPLKVLCDKLSHTRFEPSGWTGNVETHFSNGPMFVGLARSRTKKVETCSPSMAAGARMTVPGRAMTSKAIRRSI
jgi:hypothetical protein